VTKQQMGQACPGWRGDLAAYLVGALDPQARATVRRHLDCCPACRAEYENLAPVVDRLARLTPPPPRSAPATCCDHR
jgi:anti-sigma factor RsiW